MSNNDKKKKPPVGATLVLGGGVAGVQSALDLANGGYKVYLVEKSAAIGGVMAQLDKTFPTNDCSMCILAPKLVEAARHKDIELLTLSDLERLEGEAGDFTAHIRKRARYVDMEACTACTDCEAACPIPQSDEYEVGLVERSAIYRPYAQAIPNLYAISKRGTAPCRSACPIDQAAQGYVALIEEGKYREAMALIRNQNPLPGICGRVCHHPCEKNCVRGDVDEPVSIRALKRFIADWEIENEPDYSDIVTGYGIEKNGRRVAVVGAGPSGLTVAHDLALAGCDIRIFEALPVAGGMLRVGIPEYRLPREIIEREVAFLEAMGVQFTYNAELGKHFDIGTLFEDGYEAVFLGIGAHESLKLRVKGEDMEGVVGAVEFLCEFNLGNEVEVGKKVAVIGGGNAAIDAARTAKRLGADVTIVYRRTRAEMPADAAEVDAAFEEGVKLEYLAAPAEILGDGKVTGMRCIKMELGEPDDSGRRRPVKISGSEYDTEYDMIIPSISQQPVAACIDGVSEEARNEWRTTQKTDTVRPPKTDTIEAATDIELTKWNTFAADEVSGAVNTKGVFAGGDAVTGPGMVTDAMGTARKAAFAICDYLGIEAVIPKPSSLPEVDNDEVPKDGCDPTARAATPHIEVNAREGNFDEVELVLSEEQAQAEAKRCLECGICSECLECETVCKPEAIRHFEVDELLEIPVGSVVLTAGYDPFDAKLKSEYGYGRIPDVVTSMEFERMLSASGPLEGHLVRPSTEEEPIKVAWLQCVGSRDTTIDRGYCSSVCCMYATKQAVIAKEHSAIVEPTVFFMDNRSYGKEFDRYIDRAQDQYGVRYVRSRVDKIDSEDGKPVVRFEYEDGNFGREQFDIVVLSIGLGASAETVELLNKLEIETDSYGFVDAPDFEPASTSRPGVFAAGALAGPKDIPESVTEASAAAAAAGAIVAESRDTLLAEPTFPDQRDITGQAPRVGVFICHCGINIGGIVNVPEVVEFAGNLPYVVYNEENLFTCSQDTQKLMGEMIVEHNLNRVVVASCTPRTHEPLFRATLKEAGLNPYLFEMANIREHCSWVHMTEKEEATEKAKELVRMTIARCVNLEPLSDIELPVTQSALVIGGGVAGLTAASAMADSGFPVTLVERDERLGGNLQHIYYTLDGTDTAPLLKELEEKVRGNDNISVYTGAEIETINGFVGSFIGVISNGNGSTEVEVGAVVIATGASEAEHKEFALGDSDRVMTQRELEASLAGGDIPNGAKSVAMIHCVGSRDEEHYYCSRTCCSETVKNALKVKELNPEAEVYCFYRDMRTYGDAEDYYREAREKGVIFVRFDPERKPIITPNRKKLTVNFYDILLGDDVELEVDLLALAEGAWPDVAANKRLAEMLKVPLTADGFYLEAHMKLRPVDFSTEGVFVCGLAHGPKSIEESISQAQAAAARAITILAKDTITAEGRVSKVDENRCIGCGTCVSICPYIAIELDTEKGLAVVNEGLCKGCGSCAAACWSAAIDIAGVSNEQLLEAITAL